MIKKLLLGAECLADYIIDGNLSAEEIAKRLIQIYKDETLENAL